MIATALVVAVCATTANAGVLDGVAQFFGTAFGLGRAAGDANKVVDGSTFDSWKDLLYTDDGELTTENVGRIWTDKSVFSDGVTLEGDDGVGGERITAGDSDFLVALSALSSTSNLTTSTGKPLDIVLVLDVSGSMAESMYTYSEVYPTWTYGTYYIRLSDGSYQSVSYSNQNGGWGYRSNRNWTTVYPRTNSDDSNESHVQFYSRQNSGTKLSALQTSVNHFIDTTVSQNEQISDENNRHRISVVTYSQGTNVLSGLTSFTSANADQLKSQINDLEASGRTEAHNGLATAQAQLNSARSNAQKVVVFFTDGEPNQGSGFWPNVAGQAVNTAGQMKDDGALIYSIGVFDGANPADTQSNFNIYMNGVSSNYPDASATYNGSGTGSTWNPTLGTRAKNSDYYKAATDATELNSIFSEIQGEITSGAGIPTDTTTTGGYHNDGYITFTDELGAYMEVDSFKDIIYDGARYSTPDNQNPTGSEQADGSVVYTYTYTAAVDGNGGTTNNDSNLNNIKITVTKYPNSAKQGDKVEVAIPAALIPLRNFDIETDSDGATTMTCNEAYPIRIFYGVSVKDGIVDPITDADGNVIQAAAIDNPDEDLQAYIAANSSNDGKVAFFSNKYTRGAANGDTFSSFQPATTNGFYYFADEQTPIYRYNEAGGTLGDRATRSDVESATEQTTTLYAYSRTYFTAGSDGAATQHTKIYTFPGSNFMLGTGNIGYDADDNAYLVPTAHRVSHVNDNTYATKVQIGANNTNTATNAINPAFENPNFGGAVNVYLGNNGILWAELPGSLTVSKTVEIPAGLTGPSDTPTFNYTLALTQATGDNVPALPTTLQVQKYTVSTGSDGSTVETPIASEATSITANADGTFSFTLQDGQMLRVYGLDDGVGYTVAEAGTPGFTASVGTTTGAKGDGVVSDPASVAAGAESALAFTNAYSVSQTTLDGDNANFQAQKTFTAWEQNPDISFEFQLIALDASETADNKYPLPEGATVNTTQAGNRYVSQMVSNGDAFGFGNIAYTKPGTYSYAIYERTPVDEVPGVHYSDEWYRVDVTVTDNGDGTLTAASEMTSEPSTGAGGAGVPVENKIANITNGYSLEEAQVSLLGEKHFTNNVDDSDRLTPGRFNFRLEPVNDDGTPDADAPKPHDSTGNVLPTEAGNDNAYLTSHAADGSISYGAATFTQDNVGKTYIYRVSEVIPAGATQENGYTYQGTTYDPTVYYAHVTVTSETNSDGNDVVHTTVAIKDGPGADAQTMTDEAGNTVTSRDVDFTNVYNAEPAELTEDTGNAIQVTKTLTGRDWLQGESFSFTLSAADAATTAALENDAVVLGADEAASTLNTAATSNGAFPFGDVTFNKVGTYTFNVVEDIPAEADRLGGFAYDNHISTVTVVVGDNGAGALEIDSVTYNNSRATAEADRNATDAAAFTNVYAASGSTDFGGDGNLTFTKMMTGRAMQNGEFAFTIDGDDAVEAQYGTESIVSHASVQNIAADANVTRTMTALPELTFNEGDADKTFTWTVDEALPVDENGVAFADDDAETPGFQHEGVTYDQSEYEVTVSVEDNGNGTLNVPHTIIKTKNANGEAVSEDVTSTGIAFVNRYAAGPVTVNTDTEAGAQLTKILQNRDWQDGETYEFEVASVSAPAGVTAPMPDPSTVTVGKPAEGNKATFGIGTLTFDTAGTYVYQVTEKNAGRTIDGVAYSSNVARITITVRDNLEGQLVATVSSSNTQFVNTYASSVNFDDAATFTLSKTLFGRDMRQGEFEFNVQANDTDTVSAAVAAERIGIAEGETVGTVFGAAGTDGVPSVMTQGNQQLKFTQDDSGKTFSYTFSEVQGNAGGVEYDGTSYTMEVTPTDNGDGTMTIETTVTEYDASGAIVGEPATQTWTSGDEPGSVALSFENHYKPGSTTVDTDPTDTTALFTKTLTGRDWLASDSFTFRLTPVDGAPMPDDAEQLTTTVSGKTGANGASFGFGFGQLTFDDEDMAGAELNEKGLPEKTFAYQVVELGPDGQNPVAAGNDSANGVTYDSHVATFTVTVVDNGDGTMSASASATSANGSFVNEYAGELDYDAAGGLSIVKTLTGRDMDEGQFTFTVTPADQASADKLGIPAEGATFASPAASNGTAVTVAVLGNGVTFTPDDANATYTYTVEEAPVADSTPGYTNDLMPRTVVIDTSVDGSTGVISVTTTVLLDGATEESYTYTSDGAAADAAEVAFHNAYDTTGELGGNGSARINATKTLTGRSMDAGEFSFNVTDEAGNVVATGSNAAAASGEAADITFSPITYTTADAGKTFHYTVSEVTDGLAGKGVSASTPSFSIAVTVVDNGDGTCTPQVTYPEGTQGLAFANAYDTQDVALAVNGEKHLVLEDESLDLTLEDIAGKFTFTLTGTDEAGDAAPLPASTTAVNDAAGNVSFGDITFTHESLGGQTQKTFTYTVDESGSVPGVANDGQKAFSVTVTDNLDGTLTVETDPAEGALFSFVNSYSVDPTPSTPTDDNDGDGVADLTLTKVLEGRALAEGEFDFQLADAEGNVVSTGTNAADGSVTLSAITFDRPGTYEYVLTEVAGNAGGVEYDGAVHTVVAHVADVLDGTLAVTWTIDGESAPAQVTYTNVYTAQPASVTVGASKVLTGAALAEGQFAFELVDAQGNVVKATNAANGSVAFPELTFDAVGEYAYTLREVNDGQAGVTYDAATYGVTVTVADDGEGQLLASAAYRAQGADEDLAAAPTFVNAYEPPVEPEPGAPASPSKPSGPRIPATGDVLNVAAPIALLAVGAAAAFAARAIKRRS